MPANTMVDFKKGLVANLPATFAEGTIYFTTDERGIYLDTSDSTRIRIGDFQEFATLEALAAHTNPSTSALYYVTDINCLCKFNGTVYEEINKDTGATGITDAGAGNAVTGITYDATTRRLTVTKGTTFALPQDITDAIDALDLDNTYDALGAADDALDAAKDYADTKVGSVTAGDDSVTIGGTAVAPQVSVAIDDTAGNALTLVQGEGLRVETVVYGLVRESDAALIGDNAAVYRLTSTEGGVTTKIGDPINIAKDLVVESGSVVVDPAGQPAGTYLRLILANDPTHPIFINVGDLIEYVTSGSQVGDMVFVTIDANHQVTATITDGTITKAKLVTAVQNVIDNAYTGGQYNNNAVLSDITAQRVAAWDSAADDVIGDPTDDKTELTIYGTRAYADDAADTAEAQAIATVQGTAGDASTARTVAGAKAYTDEAKAEVIGDATDVYTDDTINGAKKFATKEVTDGKVELIGTATDLGTANTINGAKNYAAAQAETAKNNAIDTVVGTAQDTKTDDTVNGAKRYADDLVTSALTWGSF